MKIDFNKIVMLVMLGLILVLFIVVVCLPKKDNSGRIIEENRQLWEKTQAEIIILHKQSKQYLSKIVALENSLTKLTEIETEQTENLTTLTKKIKHLKYEKPAISFRDSSTNSVANFLTDKIQ